MPIVPWGQIVREYIAEDRCVTQQTAIWPNGKPFIVSADEVRRLFVPSIPQPAVDCQQFQQLITSAVDQRLSRSEMEAFVDHAAKCHTCRYDYELESAAKTIVQTRLKMVKTPRRTYRIHFPENLPNRSGPGRRRRRSRSGPRSLALPFIKPMLAACSLFVPLSSPLSFHRPDSDLLRRRRCGKRSSRAVSLELPCCPCRVNAAPGGF